MHYLWSPWSLVWIRMFAYPPRFDVLAHTLLIFWGIHWYTFQYIYIKKDNKPHITKSPCLWKINACRATYIFKNIATSVKSRRFCMAKVYSPLRLESILTVVRIVLYHPCNKLLTYPSVHDILLNTSFKIRIWPNVRHLADIVHIWKRIFVKVKRCSRFKLNAAQVSNLLIIRQELLWLNASL